MVLDFSGGFCIGPAGGESGNALKSSGFCRIGRGWHLVVRHCDRPKVYHNAHWVWISITPVMASRGAHQGAARESVAGG